MHRQGDADKARVFLQNADLSCCKSAACRDTLYFAVREHAESADCDAILVYNLARATYLVRRGFLLSDLFAVGGVLYIVDGAGYVCRFNEGDDYAGVPIDAYWETPSTDMGQKAATKRLCELYLRGTGGRIGVETQTASGTSYYERMMPRDVQAILEVPLTGDGRAFKLRFCNVKGSHFTVCGGAEMLFDMQRRVL